MANDFDFSFCVIEAIDPSDDESPKGLFQFQQRVLECGAHQRQKTLIMELPGDAGYRIFEHGDYVAISGFGIVNLKDRTSAPIGDDWDPRGICSELGIVLAQRHGGHIEFWDLATAQSLRSTVPAATLRSAFSHYEITNIIVAIWNEKIYVVTSTPTQHNFFGSSTEELKIWSISKTRKEDDAEVEFEIELKLQESHILRTKGRIFIQRFLPETSTWHVSVSVSDNNNEHHRLFLPCLVTGPFSSLGELLQLPLTFPASSPHFARGHIFCVNAFSQVAVYDHVTHDLGPWRSYSETAE
jgi:hypothetical protein